MFLVLSKRIPVVVALASVFLIGCKPSDAAGPYPYWPCFHGAAGDNISTDTGLLKRWPDGGPKLIWTAKGMGAGFSSVSLAHGLIYTAGNIDGKSVVIALGLDGKNKWQTPCGKAWTKNYPGTRGTPTIDGDRLYFETPFGDVVCLNAKTGNKIWGLNILEEFVANNIQWALAESVVIDGDQLICCPFGEKGSVVALDKKTGDTIWAADPVRDKAGYATPTIAEFGGRRIVLTMTSKALVGVDADAGKLLFRHEHITKYDVNALKPLYANGHVFISSGYRSGSEMVKLSAAGGKITAEQVWASKDMDNHHGGVILWDGYIYGARSSGKWVCFDWRTGETKYSERGVGKGSVTLADGLLYILSENGGKVGLVKPTPEGHEIISQFKIPPGGEGKSWAHPVVCGGRLYIRHGDFLFAFNVKE